MSRIALAIFLAMPATAQAAPDCLPQSAMFVPGQGSFGMLMYEDLFPARGDFDLNDVVVAYNWELHVDELGRLTRALLTVSPIASGGQIDSGVALTLPFAPSALSVSASIDGGASTPVTVSANGSGSLIRVIANTKTLFGVASGAHVNQDPAISNGARRTTVRGPTVLLDVQLASPQAFSITSFSPGDIFVFHTNTPSIEIHLPSYPGSAAFDASLYRTADDASVAGVRYFVDRGGIPFALALPAAGVFPREGVRLESVYPAIVDFGASGGTQATNFYATPVSGTDVAVVPGFAAALTADHPRTRFLAGALTACPVANLVPASTTILARTCPSGWNDVGSAASSGQLWVGCGNGTAACRMCQSPSTPSFMPQDVIALMTTCPTGWVDNGQTPFGQPAAICDGLACRLCRSPAPASIPAGSSFVGPSCPAAWTDVGTTASAGQGAAACPSATCRRCTVPGTPAPLPRTIPWPVAVLGAGVCPGPGVWSMDTFVLSDSAAGAIPEPHCGGGACNMCISNGSAMGLGATAMFAGSCPAGWTSAGGYTVDDFSAGATISGICAGGPCVACASNGLGIPSGARMIFGGSCPSGWAPVGTMEHVDPTAGAEVVAACSRAACVVCQAQ